MKVSKAIKKIVALGVGATMMGATILGATAAADLSNYPTFFVDGTTYDGVLVVRGDADSLASVDIASNMFVAGTTSTSTATSLEGDNWRVGTSAKKLELTNSNATSSTITGESFRDITTFIDDADLGALADGTFATNANNHGYQQFLFFDDTAQNTNIVKYDESDGDVTADFLYFKSGSQIARYKLEFTSTATSDVTDSDGAAATTGTYLDDFKNTELVFMGKKFNIVQATRPASQRSIKMLLMAGSARDTLVEGDSGSYTVGDKKYDVTLTYVDDTKAKFTINGEDTNKLTVGDTYKLKDGSELGVSEVSYQSYAGGIHSAQFYVGAQKMEMRDDGITVAGGAYNLKVGSEDIDGTTVIVTGTDDNTTYSLSTIELNMTADDDYWVPVGGKLSEVIAANGDEAEVLFGGAFDVEYSGLTTEPMHNIEIKRSSDKRYKLHVYDGDDKAVDIPIAYADTAYNLTLGEESSLQARGSQKKTILSESDWVYKDDYFVLTAGNAADGSGKSYLLQFKGADKNTKTSPLVKFRNLGSGESLEYSATTSTGAAANELVATIKLGGYSFGVYNATSQASDDYQLVVDLHGDGAISGANGNVTWIDSYGALLTFFQKVDSPGVLNATDQEWIEVRFTYPNGDDYDNVAPQAMAWNITASSDPEVRADITGPMNGNLKTPNGETEVKFGYTSMGAFLTHRKPSGDPDEIVYEYPKAQRLAQVFVTSGSTARATVVTGGGKTRVSIPLTATKLPDEVSDATAQNVISVGGPCANSVTAALMYPDGAPDNCAEGFEPGEALIKLFENGDKVAMVVAGYSGDDTRLAGKVLASRAGDLAGTEVKVQGTTTTDAVVVKVA